MWDYLKTKCKPFSPCWVGQVRTQSLTSTNIQRTKRALPRSPKITPKRDIDFEGYGTAVGGLVAAGLYTLTYPVVWLDGPLPLIDAAWFLGLGAATFRGANLGGRAGRALDQFEELSNS